MVVAALLGLTLATSIPEIDRPVVDVAEVIEAAQEDAIARELVAHHEQTGVQLAVVLVPSTMPQDIADYAQEVFDQWGGGSAQRHDGALLVLAIDDRRSRLHLGYGLEPIISDATAQVMLDDLRPSLAAGAYGDATMQLVTEVRERTGHLRPGDPIAPPRGQSRWLWALVGSIAMIAGVVWGMVVSRAKPRLARDSGSRGAGTSAGSKPPALAWRSHRYPRLRAAVDDPRVCLVFGLLVAGHVAIVVSFWRGEGFVFAYALTALWYSLLGWFMAVARRSFSWTMALCVLAGLGFGLMGSLEESVLLPGFDGYRLAKHTAFVLFFSSLAGALVAYVVWAGQAMSGQGDSYSSSGYTRSSYSSSYGSSGSSGSSSRSYRYSGGGGSSGGGGASSSW